MKNSIFFFLLFSIFACTQEKKTPEFVWQPIPNPSPVPIEPAPKPALQSTEDFTRFLKAYNKVHSISTTPVNPLKGVSIRFDNPTSGTVQNTERNFEGTFRNYQGINISQVKFPVTRIASASSAYSSELATILHENQASKNLLNAYSKFIPENTKLLAVHNLTDKTVFEFVENGVTKLKTVKLRGGGQVAVLAGALWATYELLGGENELKKYHKSQN